MSGLHFDARIHTEKLKQDIQTVNKNVKGMSANVETQSKRMNSSFAKVGAGLKSMLPVAGFAAVGLLLKKMATDVYKFSNDFSLAMREVQTISAAVQEDFKGISEEIMNMAAQGPDDAITLAKAYYQIVSAGYDGAKGLELLDVSSRAATAGITDVKTAADGLTTILNAWGKDASEAEKVSDVLFKTVEKGKTTFPELASNIATVAPIAAAMGISFEEISGAVATLTKQGATTSTAMTQIRQAIIGVNDILGDGWSQAMTFQEALQEVRDMAGGSDTKLKEMMGRVEGMIGVLALTGDKAIEAASDLDAMTESTGAMSSAYDTMMKEASNQWSTAHNKWMRELGEIGDSAKVASVGIAKFFNILMTQTGDVDLFDKAQSGVSGFMEKWEVLRGMDVNILSSFVQSLFTADEEMTNTLEKIFATPMFQEGIKVMNQDELTKLQDELTIQIDRAYDEWASLIDRTDEESEKLKSVILTSFNQLSDQREIVADAISDLIKSESDEKKVEGLPTIREQVQETLNELKSAEKELARLRAPGSMADVTLIAEKEKEIKELEQKHELLTGINRKANEKELKENEDARKKQLAATSDLNSQEIELKRQLDASIIAIEQDGAKKRELQANLEHQKELDRINQQQQSYLEAWNASQGFEPGDIGFITELPDEEIERFTQLRINAEKEKNQQIEQINKDSADEIKQIWQDVNAVFLSESERDIAEINAKYDSFIQRAQKAGETDFTAINDARAKAVEESTINAGMRMLQFEEEIEMQRAEISTQGFNRDIEVEKKKLEIVKKYAKLKIDLLKASGKEENQQEIEQLKLFIEAADKGLKDLNEKTLAESVNRIGEMASAMRDFSDETFGADSQLSSLFKELSNGAQILANIASGNYVSAAAGLIQTISGWYQQTVTSAEELTEAEKRTRDIALNLNSIYRERLRLLESLGFISPVEAFVNDIDILNQKLDISKENLEQYSHNFLLYGKTTSATIREMMDAVFGVDWGAEQLDIAMKDWDAFFENYLAKVGGVAYKNHPLSSFSWIFDKEQFNEDLNLIYDTANEIEVVYQNLQRRLTGTTTEDIAQSITDGFREGYQSIADFTSTFEEMMKDAIFRAIQDEILNSVVLDNFYQKLYEYAEGGFTKEEIDDLQNNSEYGWNALTAISQNIANGLQEVSGMDFMDDITRPEGLTGAIKGITEETAGLIAGQFTAMRVIGQNHYDLAKEYYESAGLIPGQSKDIREIGQKHYFTGLEQLDVMNQSVTHLARIQENTEYNRHLLEIKNTMNDMNRKIQTDL
jgi:hypothetical protein